MSGAVLEKFWNEEQPEDSSSGRDGAQRFIKRIIRSQEPRRGTGRTSQQFNLFLVTPPYSIILRQLAMRRERGVASVDQLVRIANGGGRSFTAEQIKKAINEMAGARLVTLQPTAPLRLTDTGSKLMGDLRR